jgi:hypothetical protein
MILIQVVVRPTEMQTAMLGDVVLRGVLEF